MRIFRYLLFPFSTIYWCILSLRNFLYSKKIKRSFSFSLPIINVGNLSMGGTGKSPHIEMLIHFLKSNYHVATLSRGYGRKVYGFQIANEDASAYSIGDEPYQFYRKFKSKITVAVDVDRVNGVSELCLQKDNVEIVLLDDAFQHRKIKPGFNILLTDYAKPFYDDWILPVGTLRESRKGKRRADVVIVTKCPTGLNDYQKLEIIKKIKPANNQQVFFSEIIYGEIKSLTNFNKVSKTQKSIVLVTGIASATSLVEQLAENFDIIKHFEFPDHYSFKQKDVAEIHDILIKFASDKPIVITTEKDAMRLLSDELVPKISGMPWYYQEIRVELDQQNEFNKIIEKYVQENSRDY